VSLKIKRIKKKFYEERANAKNERNVALARAQNYIPYVKDPPGLSGQIEVKNDKKRTFQRSTRNDSGRFPSDFERGDAAR